MIVGAMILQIDGENFVLDSVFPESISVEVDLVSEAKQKLKEAQDAALSLLTDEQREILGLKF